MANHLKIVLVTFLLMFILTEEFKPVLAKGGRLKQKVKILQKSMADLKAKMEGQEAKTKEQEAKTKEQEAKMKEQEEKIKTLEKCDACSKIKELNETINELQEKGGSKTAPAAAGLEDSEILKGDPSYLKALGEFLKPVVQSNSQWKQCWQASLAGWAAKTFHTNCDGKGPTVTIIRVGKYIFGGYTSASWGGCQYRYDSSAFLFSLVNKPGLQPLKLNQTGQGDNRRTSIYSCSSSGPTFGGGLDLYIADHASSSTKSGSNLGYTYSPPSGYSFGSSSVKSFLAGSFEFQPDEVEVFYETT